ncbi:hypothetical protein D3C74_185430 [compost metagenome]
MKTVKLSLVSKQGKIINSWSVPYARRHAALDVAMDRAEEEGHAGVLWAIFNKRKIQEFAFDSHDPRAIVKFSAQIQPFMTSRGTLDIDRFMGWQGNGGGTYGGAGRERESYRVVRT